MEKFYFPLIFSLLAILSVGCKSEISPILPSVTTTHPYTPAKKSVIIGGEITNDFEWHVSKGICYSRSPDPLIDIDPVTPHRGVYISGVDLDARSFTLTLTGLDSGATYYAKAFTVGGWTMSSPDIWHIVYGNEVSFTIN
jgi:hypothetical protein